MWLWRLDKIWWLQLYVNLYGCYLLFIRGGFSFQSLEHKSIEWRSLLYDTREGKEEKERKGRGKEVKDRLFGRFESLR